MSLPGYRPWSTSFTLEDDKKSFKATLQPQ